MTSERSLHGGKRRDIMHEEGSQFKCNYVTHIIEPFKSYV